MPVGIKMKVVGDQQLVAFLTGLEEKSSNLTPVLSDARKTMLTSIDANFRQGGRPIGWKPLSHNYLAAKLLARYSPLPLTRTGKLRRSINAVAVANRIIIGTPIKYGRIHQRGGTINIPEIRPRKAKALRWFSGGNIIFRMKAKAHSVRIPARPFLLFQDRDIDHIAKFLVKHVRGK